MFEKYNLLKAKEKTDEIENNLSYTVINSQYALRDNRHIDVAI